MSHEEGFTLDYLKSGNFENQTYQTTYCFHMRITIIANI